MKHVRQFTAVSDAPRALRMTQNFCDWLLVQNQFMLIRRRTYRFHNRINAISQLNWLATVNRISVNFAAICSGEVGIAIGHWPPWHFTSSAFQKRFPNGIRTKTCDNDLSVAPLTFGQLLRIGLKIDCNHSFRLSICHKLFVYVVYSFLLFDTRHHRGENTKSRFIGNGHKSLCEKGHAIDLLATIVIPSMVKKMHCVVCHLTTGWMSFK